MKLSLWLVSAIAAGLFLPFSAQTQNKLSDKITSVRNNDKTGTIAFASCANQRSSGSAADAAWLTDEVLHCAQSDHFAVEKTNRDNNGYIHFRLKQYHDKYPVESGNYYIHVKNGFIESVNGEFYSGIDLPPGNVISRTSAFAKAVQYFAADELKNENDINATTMESSGSVVVLPIDGAYRLSWKFDLYSVRPLKRSYIYVDALNGKILSEINRIHHSDVTGTAVTMYHGTRNITTDSVSASNYRLRESGRGLGIITLNLQNTTNYSSAIDFTDADNYWNNTANYDNAATDAHFGSEMTYDFYMDRFGRDSYDNAGAALNSYVHYSTSYVNAFWDGSRMTYGDGDGIDYTPLTSIDIVGHEITHAVTEHTAGLIYSNESGALNESFSDIFGIAIDFYANPGTANWLQGEQVSVNHIPFRSLSNPNLYDCPDTYLGDYWDPFQEVHTNSGVMNHWFYLLAVGGTGVNDNGDAFSVTAINIEKAAAIAYRSLSVYLTPNSNYADARFYAIQAAIDLYGPCSQEVIQTTNAWHAVGVGSTFSNAVISSFNALVTSFCTIPATVTFVNTSVNGASYHWDFGDGTTSTLANPSHIYSATGIYDITLITSGSTLCNNADTLVRTGYITVNNTGGPITASCTPQTQSYCCNAGIYNVTFNSINNSSANASEGYRDFTCAGTTTLTAGDPYTLQITTAPATPENVKVWIDYNNDGAFNNSNELVFSSVGQTYMHNGYIYTPVSAVLDTLLRMRITDDVSTSPVAGACTNPLRGQTEDYTVYFTANTLPPVAAFTVDDTTVLVGSTVQFYDLTIHAPSAWTWSFPGANITSSTVQNPAVIYSVPGTYTVSLTVSNSFGQDSITKVAYINVITSVNMCDAPVITAMSGTLYDSGGPLSGYLNNENCSLLVAPPCASSITLTFSSFSSESCCDFLRVYDGTDATGALLLTASGSAIPSPVTATSGTMFIRWTTDGSVTGQGYNATWTSVGTDDTIPPIAGFSASDITPPLASDVMFSDTSLNGAIAWVWDFGDGTVSTQQNPSHSYDASGIYMITLIASNCYGSDTADATITVQGPPVVAFSPDTIELIVPCGGMDSTILNIYNNGTGDLVYSPQHTSTSDSAHILAFIYGADMSVEYPNTVSAITSFYPSVSITTFNSTIAGDLQTALAGKNVLLFPEQETLGSAFYDDFSPVVLDFVTNGGTVIICGSGNTYARVADMGLFGYSSSGSVSSGSFAVDTNDAITSGLPVLINGVSLISYYRFTDPDIHRLVTFGLEDVVAYRTIGAGKAIYIGSDYYTPSTPYSMMIANSVRNNSGDSWIICNDASGTVTPNDSAALNVIFDAAGMIAGDYTSALNIHTNDPLNPDAEVVCIMHVTGDAELGLSNTCLNFDTLFEGTSQQLPLIISNSGCDSLDITMTFGTGTAFSSLLNSVSVSPFSSDTIYITFSPLSPANFIDTLFLFTNDKDSFICLTGTALAAPVISISNHTFTINLDACSAGDSLPFYITNTGGSTLNFNFNSLLSSDTAHVLSYVYGSDIAGEYAHVIDAINDHFTAYTNTTSTALNAASLTSDLSGKNVLLFIEHENSSSPSTLYSDIAPAVQQFASAGGTVIICGSAFNPGTTRMYDMGLFSGTYVGYLNSTISNMNVNDTTDVVTSGLGLTIPSQNAVMYHDFTDPLKKELVSYNGYDVVTSKSYGLGRIIYIGYDYYDYDINASRIMANSVRSVTAGIASANVYVSPDSGSADPGDSVLVYLHYSSDGLAEGQHEGYVIIQSNDPLLPFDTIYYTLVVAGNPCADFSYEVQSTCTSTIPFTDLTFNNPDSWLWSFGDGTTSTMQHPIHTYSAAGTYAVQLVACNGALCDTAVQNIIIYGNIAPGPAFCYPVTNAYCCTYGIRQVVLGSINNISSDGSEGYMDFTCSDSTTLTAGQTYTLGVATHPSLQENCKAWIDFNNNLLFDPSEMVYSGSAVATHSAQITVPVSAVLNTPLRLRIASDNSSYSIGSSGCTNVQNGQYEDYTVFIEGNAAPPVAQINYTIQNNCNGLVQFNGIATGSPTSWQWDFGDLGSSTMQNPLHQYASPGTYNVTLITSNQFGSDTATLSVTVNTLAAAISVAGVFTVNETIYFTAVAPASSTYYWSFGNGSTSFLANPTTVYSVAGTYLVGLIVTNGGCIITVYDTIIIMPVGIDDISGDGFGLSVYPNPYAASAEIRLQLLNAAVMQISITDLAGRQVEQLQKPQLLQPGRYIYNPGAIKPGIYFINAMYGEKKKSIRLIRL